MYKFILNHLFQTCLHNLTIFLDNGYISNFQHSRSSLWDIVYKHIKANCTGQFVGRFRDSRTFQTLVSKTNERSATESFDV